MKKVFVCLFTLLILVSSLFAAESEITKKDATLVLNFDEEKFLVGFSSSANSITAFANDEIMLKAENNSTLETFSLKFENDVYLYYKAVTNPSNTFKIKLSIMNPLRLNGSDDVNTIPYTLTVNKVLEKWDGTGGEGNVVHSPILSGSKYTANSVLIGNIRASGNTNYLVTGFAELSITSEKSLSIPFGTYKSTVKVSIVTD